MNIENYQIEKVLQIEGFDPLREIKEKDKSVEKLLEESRKRDVLNILRSYTGIFDIFNELIQNALDAVEKKYKARNSDYKPKIWITIDIPNSRISVVDNGVGMSLHEFLYCPRPNVSFKKRRELRGHKGVGSTFLAYGFSYYELHSKIGCEEFAGALQQGRQWAEDNSSSIPKPVFQQKNFSIPLLQKEDSGTSVTITIGNRREERPNLNWLGIDSAEQWIKILRIKTPLGGVYLNTPPFCPEYIIKVVAQDRTTEQKLDNIHYYYPHDFEVLNKVQDIKSVKDALNKIHGDPKRKQTLLPNEFKRLDCIYEIWDRDTILEPDSPFHGTKDQLSEEQVELIQRHNIVVYGCFMKSRTVWSAFHDKEIKVRKNIKVIAGGLQLASDYMVQGDLSAIPLTSAAGYQSFAHVIVHFTDGNPDVGRKVFQPELKDLSEFLAKKVVAEFRKYRNLMAADTGASPVPPSKILHEWKRSQEDHQKKSPLKFLYNGSEITVLSTPQQEQDVVVLFHQLIGIGLIKGLYFYSATFNEKYDALFMYKYDNDETYSYNEDHLLGVKPELSMVGESSPLVLEYKYSFDALNSDIDTEIKDVKDIDFVVAWTSGKDFQKKFELRSLLVGDEGATRTYYGSTHVAYLDTQPVFEIMILEDLLDYIQDRIVADASQRKKYS